MGPLDMTMSSHWCRPQYMLCIKLLKFVKYLLTKVDYYLIHLNKSYWIFQILYKNYVTLRNTTVRTSLHEKHLINFISKNIYDRNVN